MASTLAERIALRRLSRREREEDQDRMEVRSYQAGEVIWRTHGPLRWKGTIQSGEIELEYRVNGTSVRTTRLYTGDPLPPRALQERRMHGLVIARAVTDVRLGVFPVAGQADKRSAVREPVRSWMIWLWLISLLLLVAFLARDDLIRITSGLLYLTSTRDVYAVPGDPRSMDLLRAARQVDKGAAFAYNEEGYRWFQQDKLSEAATAFDQAVASDPSSAPALNNLGITDFVQGDPVQAADRLRRALEQNPDNATARYNLGMTLMQLQNPVEALREFREASFIDPQDAWPLLRQAYLYQQTGDYANAEQRARSAIQLNSSLTPAQLLLGMALYEQGREAEALTSFQDALVLEPGNRTAAFYQALILGHQKQYEAALPILYELFLSSTDGADTARILAEMDALYRFQAEPATAGP